MNLNFVIWLQKEKLSVLKFILVYSDGGNLAGLSGMVEGFF